MIDEDDLNDDLLYNTIMTLYKNKDTYIKNMDKSSQSDAVKIITELLYKTAKKSFYINYYIKNGYS